MSDTTERDAVIEEFFCRTYTFTAMADEIVRLRERISAVEVERDLLEMSRDTAHSIIAHVSNQTGIVGDWTVVDKVILLRDRADRAERILAALRTPSEALVEATAAAEVPRTWPTLSEADRAALRFIARTTIVAAVAAAEQEVG